MNRKQNILTVEELADLLRVEKGTIYKLVKAHKIPAFKIGRVWRFNTKPQRRQRGMRIEGYDACSAGCRFPRVCEFLFSVRLIEGSTRSDFPQAATTSRAAPSTDSTHPPAEEETDRASDYVVKPVQAA